VLNGPTDTVPLSSGGNVLTASSNRRASSSNPIQRSLRINLAHSHDGCPVMELTQFPCTSRMDVPPLSVHLLPLGHPFDSDRLTLVAIPNAGNAPNDSAALPTMSLSPLRNLFIKFTFSPHIVDVNQKLSAKERYYPN
jgi:hypothetical protein